MKLESRRLARDTTSRITQAGKTASGPLRREAPPSSRRPSVPRTLPRRSGSAPERRHRRANLAHGAGQLLIDSDGLNPRYDIRLYGDGRQPIPAPHRGFFEPVGEAGNLRK